MLASFLMRASLTGLLLAAGWACAAVAAQAPDGGNIGFVLYTKSYAPGTLNARTAPSTVAQGSRREGPRTGSPADIMFATSTTAANSLTSTTLVIEKVGDTYKLSWITDGKVSAIGVGMEVEHGLAVGWRRVAD